MPATAIYAESVPDRRARLLATPRRSCTTGAPTVRDRHVLRRRTGHLDRVLHERRRRHAFGFIDLQGARGDARGPRPPRRSRSAWPLHHSGWRSHLTSGATTPRTAPASARRDSTSTVTSSPRQEWPCDYHLPVLARARVRNAPLLRQRHRRRRAHRTDRGRGCGGQRRDRAAHGLSRRHAADRHPQARTGQEDRALGEGPGLGRGVHERRGPQPLHRSLPDRCRRHSPTASCARRSTRASRRGSTSASRWPTTPATCRQGNPTRLSATSAKVGRRAAQGPRRPRADPVRPQGEAARSPVALHRRIAGRPDGGRDLDGARRRAPGRWRPAAGSPTGTAATRSTSRRGRAGPSAWCSAAPPGRSRPRAGCRSACRRRARSRRRAPGCPPAASASPAACAAAACPCPRGLVVVLQGREGGKWRTFSDARTHRKGRWHVSYRFSGRPGSYPIRLRIRRQAGFPFELGYSRRLTIRVG